MAVRIGLGAAGFLAAGLALAPFAVRAQTPANLLALRGLAPVTALGATEPGRAALRANYTVTAGIQTGELRQPNLLPFPQQQQLALRDAFITGGNAVQLADGLGTRLGEAYAAAARYDTPRSFSSASPAVEALISYTNGITATDSNAGKYVFANGTTDGRKPASAEALAILSAIGGVTDVFGKAYDRPAGSPGADPFGNSRPFQTEPRVAPIAGSDYFGAPSDNAAHLNGPTQDLRDSPSYPSGHTTYGTMESLLLALMVPERYPQMVVRAAEYGNNRIVLGAHYAMDVIAGRTLSMYDVAHLLANDPVYVGQQNGTRPPVTDYPAALAAARRELLAVLEAGCRGPVAACAASDTSRFADDAANAALVEATLTYGLPAVYPEREGMKEDVGTLAPEAGHLLTAAFPKLTLEQANAILTETEGPGGGFLDNGSGFGVYSRLNLYAAAKRAAAVR